jgi:hypothetical protein
MSSASRRLSPEAARDAALEAVPALLVESGPGAVTLRPWPRGSAAPANLLHQFGSARVCKRH